MAVASAGAGVDTAAGGGVAAGGALVGGGTVRGEFTATAVGLAVAFREEDESVEVREGDAGVAIAAVGFDAATGFRYGPESFAATSTAGGAGGVENEGGGSADDPLLALALTSSMSRSLNRRRVSVAALNEFRGPGSVGLESISFT